MSDVFSISTEQLTAGDPSYSYMNEPGKKKSPPEKGRRKNSCKAFTDFRPSYNTQSEGSVIQACQDDSFFL